MVEKFIFFFFLSFILFLYLSLLDHGKRGMKAIHDCVSLSSFRFQKIVLMNWIEGDRKISKKERLSERERKEREKGGNRLCLLSLINKS